MQGLSAIDISTLRAAATLLELCILIDQRIGGYPKAGTDVGPGVHAPASVSVTTGYTRPWTHPTVTGRYMVIVDAKIAAYVTAVIAACQAKVTAGTATQVETDIAALPSPSPLDATWDAPATASVQAQAQVAASTLATR